MILALLSACRSEPSPTPPVSSGERVATPVTATPQIAKQPTDPPVNSPADQPTNPSSAPAIPEASPAAGGAIILGLVGQPDRLNPITDNYPAVRELQAALFETLLQVDPDTATLQPGLAQSWEYSETGDQVIFHLPPNLKWSDGSALTAAGVAESLRATQHPALSAFSHIEAPDSTTLALTFSRIDCAAVTTLAQLPLLSSASITATVPVGSGPFMVENWSDNKKTLALTRNPNYHGPLPFLEKVTVRFIPEDDVAVALSEGRFDLLGPVEAPLSNAGPLPRPRQLSNFTRLTYPAPKVIYLAINFDPRNEAPVPPAVRRALSAAIDRQAILATALDDDGVLLPGSLLPDHWAANPDRSPPEYDPDAARSLLAEAGLRDSDGDGWLDQGGERLELSIRLNGQNKLHQDLGWLISSYYREVGLFARAEGVPFDSLIDDLFTHDFRLALFNWPLLPDPDQHLYWHSTENSEGLGLNFVSLNSPRVDRLLDRARAVPGCEPAARAKIYHQLQQALAQETPADFLMAPNRHAFVGDRLQGVQPGPFAPLTWNIAEWYLGGE